MHITPAHLCLCQCDMQRAALKASNHQTGEDSAWEGLSAHLFQDRQDSLERVMSSEAGPCSCTWL